MAASLRCFPTAAFVCLVIFICSCFAGRNFNAFLVDIKCNHNTKFASNSSCSLNGPAPATGANFDMQLKKPIKEFRMDLIFYLERMKKFFLLFQAPDMDVCEEFHKNITILYVQLLKDMTLRAGKWPKCPIPEDFYFKFENLTPNLDYAPAYLPEVGFKMELVMKDKKEIFLNLSVLGKIVHKQSKKGKHRH